MHFTIFRRVPNLSRINYRKLLAGNVKCGSCSNETKIDAIGGIVGYQSAGTVSKAYNKGILEGGDSIGGVVGQQSNTTLSILNSFYNTEQNIKGVGTDAEDVSTKVKKIDKIFATLDEFLVWLNNGAME